MTERWQFRDPLEVLMRKGEDCTNCKHLKRWSVFDRLVMACEKGKKVGRRCNDWRHQDAK